MAPSSIFLTDLKAGRCSATVRVRLLRFWEARNFNKKNMLLSVDMLFVDSNSTMLQGTVSALRQQRFRERLTEGSVYSLTGFDVARSTPRFRLSDEPFTIRFNDGTEMEKLESTAADIPTEVFRFRPYDQWLELANSGRQLPDVVGELCTIRSTITDRLPGAQRVMLTLRFGRDSTVCVSLFDSLASTFHTKFDCYGKEPQIVIATGLNPKIVAGKLYLNGTSATRLFFDTETSVGRAELERLSIAGTNEAPASSKIVHAQKIEPLTVSELNQYVVTADPQVIEFLCTAKVDGIELDEGWSYIGCSKCSKKLIREETSFTCVRCNESNAVAELRYRVVFSVSDSTGSAGFVGFDVEVAKLTHVAAAEAGHIVGTGINAEVDVALPRSLADLVGNVYTFQLKLKEFNFTVNHQTFTISRVFPSRELAPLPTFAENDGAPTEDVDGRDAMERTAAEEATTTEPPESDTGTGGEKEVEKEENASKKPRVV